MTAPTFKDHFSRQAADYSRYRPAYPSALIAYVASLAPGRALAVDCATGNGQAAVALAEHFDQVLAVDASAAQLEQALPHPRVRYERALAEALPVADGAVALVAVAQAIHWFDFDRFHAECRRVLMPGGVVAAWTYTVFRAGGAIDEVVDRFYHDTIGPYWPPEREYVQQGYRDDPVPLGRDHAAAVPAADRVDARAGDRLFRELVRRAAVPGCDTADADPLPDVGASSPRPGPSDARFVSTGRSTCGSAGSVAPL